MTASSLSCGMWDLLHWPGIEAWPPALGAWNASHWTTREVPYYVILSCHIHIWDKQSEKVGTSLVAQWLRSHFPMQRVQVRSLVGEVRSPMLCGQKRKKPEAMLQQVQWRLWLKKMTTVKKIRQCVKSATALNEWEIHRRSFKADNVRNLLNLILCLGAGNGSPLQYSCQENPMNRGAWRVMVHGVTRVAYDLVTKPPILCLFIDPLYCVYLLISLYIDTERRDVLVSQCYQEVRR